MPSLVRTAEASLPPSSRHSGVYRPDVDGLRAIAIISVVLFHAGLSICSGGFVGVDIFFVISGYLVGGHVFQEITAQRFSYSVFYARRARRIVPAFVAMVLAVTFISVLLMSADELIAYSKSALAAVAGLSNLWFWHSTEYFSPDARLDPMLMTWSLGLEEQFYLILPLGLLFLRRVTGRYVVQSLQVLTGVSLVAFALAASRYPSAAFYLLPLRLWELGVGTLVSVMLQQGRLPPKAIVETLGWGGIVAMLTSVLLFDEGSMPSGSGVVIAVFGAASSIVAGGSWINRRVLASAPMIGIGLVSYSWYLWHWPLMAFVRLCSVGDASAVALTCMALLSFVFACLSWRFVEQPFRVALVSGGERRVLTRYGAIIGLVTLVPLSLYGCSGLPSRVGSDSAEITNAIKAPQSNPCMAGPGDIALNTGARCVTGTKLRIAVVGDSHAAMLADSLREIASRHGFGTEVFAKSTCPTLVGLTHDFPLWPAHAKQCATHNAQVLRRLINDRAVKIIFMEAGWGAPLLSNDRRDHYRLIEKDGRIGGIANASDFERGLRITLALAHRYGKKVVLMDDVPVWNFDPARQLYVTRLSGRAVLQTLLDPEFHEKDGLVDGRQWETDDSDVSQRVKRSALASPGTLYVPLKEAFCSGANCRYRTGGTLFFFDKQHLTRAGADAALQHFASQIEDNPNLWNEGP